MSINGEYLARKQRWDEKRERGFSEFQSELMWLESGFVSSLYAYDNDYRDEGREEASSPLSFDRGGPEQAGNESKKRNSSQGHNSENRGS